MNPKPCTHPDCKPLGPCPGCGAAEAPGWVEGWHGWTCGSKNTARHGDPVQFVQSIKCAKAEGARSEKGGVVNTCETCIHWKTKGEVLGEPDRKTVAAWGRLDKKDGALRLADEMRVHVCTQGWFSTSNVDESLDYTGIGTDYTTAELITDAGFGCVHHEQKS